MFVFNLLALLILITVSFFEGIVAGLRPLSKENEFRLFKKNSCGWK